MQGNFDEIEAARADILCYGMCIIPFFEIAKHHEVIADALEKVERGEIKRLIIEAPPRHGKTTIVSELFVSRYIGRNPKDHIIFTTYGQEYASDIGRRVRNITASPEFLEIFPNSKLSEDSQSNKKFNTTLGGAYYAVGRGGSITGRGGNLIIVDDLLKNNTEADSPQIRKNCIDFYKRTLYTRLQPNGAIVIISTRWHEEDLIGVLLDEEKRELEQKEGWVVLSLKAIGNDGKALWPERYNVENLKRIKRRIGERSFNCLYQQEPSSETGKIIKRASIKYYKDLPPFFNIVIQSWDLSFGDKEKNDYVVGQVWGKIRGQAYLIYQLREKLDFPDTIEAFKMVSNMFKHFSVGAKYVEAKANGQALIDSLKREISGIIPIFPKDSKASRLNSVSPFYEAGNVFFPEDAEFTPALVEEIVNFPAKHDDQVDAMTQALSKILLSGSSGQDEYNTNETTNGDNDFSDIRENKW